MKKLVALVVFGLCTLYGKAQLYTKISYYDKFDDVIKQEVRKTLITKTDSTIVIEEKGKDPVVYYIENITEPLTKGTKDEPANLVANVYGYETTWLLVREDQLDDYYDVFYRLSEEPDKRKSQLLSYWLIATHRTITTKYTGTYQGEAFWLEDSESSGKLGKGVNRIIYENR